MSDNTVKLKLDTKDDRWEVHKDGVEFILPEGYEFCPHEKNGPEIQDVDGEPIYILNVDKTIVPGAPLINALDEYSSWLKDDNAWLLFTHRQPMLHIPILGLYVHEFLQDEKADIRAREFDRDFGDPGEDLYAENIMLNTPDGNDRIISVSHGKDRSSRWTNLGKNHYELPSGLQIIDRNIYFPNLCECDSQHEFNVGIDGWNSGPTLQVWYNDQHIYENIRPLNASKKKVAQ